MMHSRERRRVCESERVGGKTYEIPEEGKKRVFSFASSPRRGRPRPRERELPLISVSLASAGTSSQAKTKRKRLTMFMFSLLAKDDFNTNTASTINIFFVPLPYLSLSLLRGWQLHRPQGLLVTVMTLAALLLRKLRRGTNEQMDKQRVNVTSLLKHKPNLTAFQCAERRKERWKERRGEREEGNRSLYYNFKQIL